MNCYYHSDREPVGMCASCGKPICKECKVALEGRPYTNKQTSPYCNKCISVFSEDERFTTIECSSWEAFLAIIKPLQYLETDDEVACWIFRGQRKAHRQLCTALERACNRFNIDTDTRHSIEREMIREFERRVHHYESNVPNKDSLDEWMALMRHYGAPTRLLDCTYSPYIAVFFALEEANKDEKIAVWAINAYALEGKLEKKLISTYLRYSDSRCAKDFNTIFVQHGTKNKTRRLVLAVNPFRLNERLAYQKGIFLCPTDVNVSFMDNLFKGQSDNSLKQDVLKYVISTGDDGNVRDQALKHLDQMNINKVTLFPGLDGFAKSLEARIPSFFRPKVVARREGRT